MTELVKCEYCRCTFPIICERCPHCARPGLFPNVRAAEDEGERKALNHRYLTIKENAARKGAMSALNDFELAIQTSKAVINRSINELQRIATSENELYASYYKLVDAGVKIPSGSKWDIIRVLTDAALFPGYREHIRFAALTLDTNGLTNYGECSLIIREDMIAHRASVFEENSVIWMDRHGIKVTEVDKLHLAVVQFGANVPNSQLPN